MNHSLKKAIMNRRMSILNDPEEMEMRKDANLNPDEGSQDDLTIAIAKGDEGSPEEEGMETAADEAVEDGDRGLAPATSPDKASSDQPEESIAHKLFVKSDEGRPGIRGKVAAKMKAAMALRPMKK